ncbi:MAG TPA: ATP synthase F0 subunit B [Polyangiaceae bacterium]|nr:ATP synthase F0 subunit B [Polyangiaceae bacterium]
MSARGDRARPGAPRRLAGAIAAALALSAGGAGLAWAQPAHGPEPARPAVRPGARPGQPPPAMPPRPGRPGAGHDDPHGGAARPGAGGHADPHGSAAQAGGGAHHGPEPINWAYGLLGERDGVAPSLLYRPAGMPVPLLANVINFGLLALLGVRFGRKPLAEGLVKRRETLMREMDEAARLKREAEARLQTYKKRLEKVDDEIERIKSDYAAQAKRDRERIVREAEEKRERMRRDADFLLQQERKAAVERLTERTADEAVRRAEALLRAGVGDDDQQRLADEYLRDVTRLGGGGGVRAGGAA